MAVYLCLRMEMQKTGIPRFRGYCLDQGFPWEKTANSWFSTPFMEFENKEHAYEFLSRLAEADPASTWAYMWKWVDPSYEAHCARFDLEQSLADQYEER